MECFFKTLNLILPSCSVQICSGLEWSISVEMVWYKSCPSEAVSRIRAESFTFFWGDVIIISIHKVPHNEMYNPILVLN